MRRFEQEARAAAGLNHPGILTVHEIGFADGAPYVVSELLALREKLAAGPLPLDTAVGYSLQICHANRNGNFDIYLQRIDGSQEEINAAARGERFHPTTGIWSTTGAMAARRSGC